MLSAQTNPLLFKTEAAIKSKVPPQLAPLMQRIVAAGEKVMYSPTTHQMMIKALSGPGDKGEIAGAAASKLIALLFTQMHGKLDMRAAIPAGVVLLCEGLDWMEKARMLTVNNATLSTAMKSMMTSTLQLFGVTPQKLAQMHAGQSGQQGGAPGAQSAMPPGQPPAPQQPAGIIAGAQGAM